MYTMYTMRWVMIVAVATVISIGQWSCHAVTINFHGDPWMFLEDVFVIRPARLVGHSIAGSGMQTDSGSCCRVRPCDCYGTCSHSMPVSRVPCRGAHRYARSWRAADHAANLEVYGSFIQQWPRYRCHVPQEYHSMFEASYERYELEGAWALEDEADDRVHAIRYAVYRHYPDRYARQLRMVTNGHWNKHVVVDLGSMLLAIVAIFDLLTSAR
jgi:hypothetical protein